MKTENVDDKMSSGRKADHTVATGLLTIPLHPARAAERKKAPRKRQPVGGEPCSKSPKMLLCEISSEITTLSMG